MTDPRENPSRDLLINVISSAPVRNYQEARYKAEWLLEVVDEVEAEVEEFNRAEMAKG